MSHSLFSGPLKSSSETKTTNNNFERQFSKSVVGLFAKAKSEASPKSLKTGSTKA